MKYLVAAMIGCVVAVGSGGRPQARSGQAPVFRAETSVVSVDVAVRRGAAAVANLQSRDFELTDAGVIQHIDALSIEMVPLDVTLVMDASGSSSRAIARVESDARQMAAFLRPVDRLRLITCG